MSKNIGTLFVLSFLVASCGGVAGNLNPVAKKHQSPHLEDVKPHLDFGGTMYTYMDVEGDPAELAEQLQKLLDAVRGVSKEETPPNVDVKALVSVMGFDNVDAIGLSSYQDGDIYRNKAFIHQSGPREGLMKIFGGAPHDFEVIGHAPHDADFLYQSDLNLAALWTVLETIINQIAGENLRDFTTKIDAPLGTGKLTIRRLLESLDTQMAMVVRINGDKYLTNLDGSLSFPHTEVVLTFDDAELIYNLALMISTKAGVIKSEKDGNLDILKTAVPLPGDFAAYDPVIAFDNDVKKLYVSSSRGLIDEYMKGDKPIAGNPSFVEAAKGLPRVGNSISYVSSELWSDVQRFVDNLSIKNPGKIESFSVLKGFIPESKVGVASVSVNMDDGIFFQSNHTDSHKATLFTMGFLNPMTLGVLAAVAIPAFTNYMKRAKTSEAKTNVELCILGVSDYFVEHGRFPVMSKDWTPLNPPSDDKYPADQNLWAESPWADIGFQVMDDHYYRYRLVIEGNTAVCQAQADLDGDGIMSLFEKTASIENDMLVPALEILETDPLE